MPVNRFSDPPITTDEFISIVGPMAGILGVVAIAFGVGWTVSPAPLDFGCVDVRPVDGGQGVSVSCPGTSETIFEIEDSILVRCQCEEKGS